MKDKSKNILLVTSEFPPQPGGIGNHALNLAKYLSKSGYRLSVITDTRSKANQIEIDFDASLDFAVHRVKLQQFRIRMYFERIWLLFKFIKNANIIIASGKFSLWIVAFASIWYKRKYLAVIHGSEVNFPGKLIKVVTNFSLNRFSKIIAVSRFTQGLIKVNCENVVVIPNGFDVNQWNVKTTKKEDLIGTPKLITVGNVTKRKGQQNVIKQLPELLKIYPEMHYYCVGLPTEKDAFLEEAKALKVNKHVHFLGSVSSAKLKSLLLSSDIFVMLSSKTNSGDVEGFGIALLEANYLGIPCIGATNCGIEDAIKNEVSGRLIAVNDTTAFASAIKNILENYSCYSKNAREWAMSHTWEIIIKQYIQQINS